MARPRTPGGAYGSIAVRRRDRVIAETRIRDADGRLRHVRVTARTAAQARQVLRERLLDRPLFGSTRVLTPQSGADSESLRSRSTCQQTGVGQWRPLRIASSPCPCARRQQTAGLSALVLYQRITSSSTDSRGVSPDHRDGRGRRHG